ncbi:MAG: DUF2599 domain-containing protein [Propionibacteriaceae bacterium]|nr:DUF2599 domain-containing protein [Propionibacteriaceae bacterium]
MRTIPRVLATSVALALTIGSPNASADEQSDKLSDRDYATLTRIIGHEPSAEEQHDYLQKYGRVPTDAEIEAYLNAANDASPSPTSADEGTQLDASQEANYFKSTKWINRSGVWSLSLMPRDGGIGNEGVSRTWNYVYAKHNTDRHWSHYKSQGADKSMRWQYECHFWYGMIKTPWNLEPSKKYEDLNSITCN